MTKESIESWLNVEYPLTIVSDRYNGGYSKGKYIAFPLEPWEINWSVNGNDIECMNYWNDFAGIIGKGNTPDEAFEDLKNHMMRELEFI